VWHDSSFTAQGAPRAAPGYQFRAAHTAWYYLLLLCWAAAGLGHSTTQFVNAMYDSSALYFAQQYQAGVGSIVFFLTALSTLHVTDAATAAASHAYGRPSPFLLCPVCVPLSIVGTRLVYSFLLHVLLMVAETTTGM
jgi:hypothetical protein